MAGAEPIVREIWIDALPEDVFAYFTQKDLYLRWMGISAELDARPGGVFRVEPNARTTIRGEFIEVVPPTRLVFTWGHAEPGHPVPPGSTRVEIELVPQDGGTLVRLVHRGLDGEQRERHAFGWTHYLGRFRLAATGSDPGPDPYASPAVRHG
ncbi:MAG TPA: SRPBCC family protein [Myxococcota bacterium]|nr:SRPBCC family protein [Myxococcota bacterium]